METSARFYRRHILRHAKPQEITAFQFFLPYVRNHGRDIATANHAVAQQNANLINAIFGADTPPSEGGPIWVDNIHPFTSGQEEEGMSIEDLDPTGPYAIGIQYTTKDGWYYWAECVGPRNIVLAAIRNDAP